MLCEFEAAFHDAALKDGRCRVSSAMSKVSCDNLNFRTALSRKCREQTQVMKRFSIVRKLSGYSVRGIRQDSQPFFSFKAACLLLSFCNNAESQLLDTHRRHRHISEFDHQLAPFPPIAFNKKVDLLALCFNRALECPQAESNKCLRYSSNSDRRSQHHNQPVTCRETRVGDSGITCERRHTERPHWVGA